MKKQLAVDQLNRKYADLKAKQGPDQEDAGPMEI
jgi:hypothetical protein